MSTYSDLASRIVHNEADKKMINLPNVRNWIGLFGHKLCSYEVQLHEESIEQRASIKGTQQSVMD